ncbi:hypothetical protein ADUPG1_001831, partial [Aduncisulcus paluster]
PIQEPVPAKHSTPIEHQVATKSDSVAAESSEHEYDVDDSVSVNVSNVPEAKTVKHVKSKSDLGATDEDESGHTVESGHMVESGHTVESGDSSDGEGVIAPIKHIDETGESVDNAPHGVNVTIAVSDTTPTDLFSSKNPSSSTAVAAEMQAVVSNEQAVSADDHDSMSADDHDSISADDHDSMSTDDHESMSAGHECHVDLDVGVH